MTNSEKLTSMIAEKFFLPQYIYTDVFVKTGKQENEFCDCLLEFESVYVIIQIKERGAKTKVTDEEWFAKKVVKRAKEQLRDTLAFYADTNNSIFSKTTDLTIDRAKTILPVIVFLNPDLSNYERVVRSETLGQVINIFSYADFETMLQTVVLPYDIVFYLQYRLEFEGIDSGRLIFDDVDDNTTFVSRLVTEKDYAQMFLSRTYYRAIIKHNLSEDQILYYNDLISQLNASCKNDRSPFMSGLLRVDYERAATIVKNWQKLLELAKVDEFVFPFTFTVDDREYMFMVKPKRIPELTFDLYMERILIYHRYKYKSNHAHIIFITHVDGEQFNVEITDVDLTALSRYDALVEETVAVMEST